MEGKKMRIYEPYQHVEAIKSNSSYGRWVVKTDEVTFRFFWNKAQADQFADRHNDSVTDYERSVERG
jgi:hypothetical protein